jgi:hypothetical protein
MWPGFGASYAEFTTPRVATYVLDGRRKRNPKMNFDR